MEQHKTFGALKASGYTSRDIKTELRENLIARLREGETVFDGIHGYDNTVIPQVERAILSGHNINLLGLRGQAKTRIARLMVNLLDEYIPVVAGSEINDDPFFPLSRKAKQTLEELGDDTPIEYLHRDDRFAEKLATPDVTVADLIGDVDPIKAANLKLSYADDRVIHYGMIPRANRCIFVINELPDLQARIQVALFNILQEGDVQIRGFKLRLPLDMQFVFTANPEDYTNRGSIVTPLKDRIGSQILTHYPADIETAKKITQQEFAKVGNQEGLFIPELATEIIEQISFEARDSEYVDAKSGVSARMSISAFENLISTARHRMILSGQDKTSVRMSDFMGVIPAITGKVELVYEGEQEGADGVAEILINAAIGTVFETLFPKIEKLEKQGEQNAYTQITEWFFENTEFSLEDDMDDAMYRETLESVGPLSNLVLEYQPEVKGDEKYFLMEFVLWALVSKNKLSKNRYDAGFQFSDLYGSYLKGI